MEAIHLDFVDQMLDLPLLQKQAFLCFFYLGITIPKKWFKFGDVQYWTKCFVGVHRKLAIANLSQDYEPRTKVD
jgi:hypothetical protein